MIEEPRCSVRRCKHLEGVKQPNDDESVEFPYCPAFPDGIPEDIAYGDNPHLVIDPRQVKNGVTYEKDRS